MPPLKQETPFIAAHRFRGAVRCYLKPYLDPNMSWFEQARRGLI